MNFMFLWKEQYLTSEHRKELSYINILKILKGASPLNLKKIEATSLVENCLPPPTLIYRVLNSLLQVFLACHL